MPRAAVTTTEKRKTGGWPKGKPRTATKFAGGKKTATTKTSKAGTKKGVAAKGAVKSKRPAGRKVMANQ